MEHLSKTDDRGSNTEESTVGADGVNDKVWGKHYWTGEGGG